MIFFEIDIESPKSPKKNKKKTARFFQEYIKCAYTCFFMIPQISNEGKNNIISFGQIIIGIKTCSLSVSYI